MKALASLLFLCSILPTAHAEVLPGLTEVKQLKGTDDRGLFNLHYVQLTAKVANESVRTKVNKLMEEMAMSSICEADAERRDSMESNFFVKVSYGSLDVLAIEANQYYFCGGAHPDGGITSYLYDLRSGEEAPVESQIADAEGFRAAVVSAVLANVPRDADECGEFYTREEFLSQSFNYTVAEGKLVASPQFPHAIAACIFETDVPYSAIGVFVKADSVLDRVIRASRR